MPGFVACLENVLVKVSGDANLLHDPRGDVLKQHADTYVSTFDYRDLYSGMVADGRRPARITGRFAA